MTTSAEPEAAASLHLTAWLRTDEIVSQWLLLP